MLSSVIYSAVFTLSHHASEVFVNNQFMSTTITSIECTMGLFLLGQAILLEVPLIYVAQSYINPLSQWYVCKLKQEMSVSTRQVLNTHKANKTSKSRTQPNQKITLDEITFLKRKVTFHFCHVFMQLYLIANLHKYCVVDEMLINNKYYTCWRVTSSLAVF